MNGEQKVIAIIAVAYFIFMASLFFAPDEGAEKYKACIAKNTPAQCEDVG